MNKVVKNRIEKLQTHLKSLDLDAAIIMDRENLIYFTLLGDIEAGALIVPKNGNPRFVCLWLDAKHVREVSGLDIEPYFFPNENVSKKTANLINGMQIEKPKLGFTRYFISLKDYQSIRDSVPGVYFGDIAEICYKIRSEKDSDEIDKIKKASEIVKIGMNRAMEYVKPGITENDVLAEAEYVMRKAGSEGATFRMQVLRHDRQQLIHPYAGDYILNDNEPVVIHLGATYKCYTSKMCRTVFLGNVHDETRKIYDVLVNSQRMALSMMKDGVTAGEVYEAAYRLIHENGYGKMFLPTIGYGVGIRQSEFYPILSKGSKQVLKKNMVVDILMPTIYMAKHGGPRITDTILVEEDGCVNLTEL